MSGSICIFTVQDYIGGSSTIGSAVSVIISVAPGLYAQYSLECYNQPLGISGFEGVNILTDGYKHSLSSIKDIENEMKQK